MPSGTQHNEQTRLTALGLMDTGLTAKQVGEQLDVPASTVRQWRKTAGKAATILLPNAVDPQVETDLLHAHPESSDKKFADLDLWGAFDAIESLQDVVGASSPGQDSAAITIDTDKPVVILPTADWHLGSYAVDHKQLRAYIQRILGLDRVYLVLLGDAVDNFPASFKSAAAVFGQVIPPKIQHRLLTKILLELVRAGKILCRTWGNHEEFSDRVAGGIDTAYDDLVPYLKTMGRLYLTVGKTEYKIFASHTFPGKSYLHANHQNKRAVRMLWTEADIAMSGHTHQGPEHEEFVHDGRHRIAVLCGTAKTDDTYSKRYYGQSQFSDQAIVLYPDRHKMVPFRCLDDALVYLKGSEVTGAKAG